MLLTVFSLYIITFISTLTSLSAVRLGKVTAFLSTVSLFLFSPLFLFLEGFQGDIVHYESYFDKTNHLKDIFLGSGAWKGDFGFGAIILFSKLFSSSYVFFIFVQAFFQLLFWFLGALFISKCFPYSLQRRTFSLVVLSIISTPYFHFFLGNTLRQGLATSSIFLFLALSAHSLRRSAYFTYLISAFFHKFVLVYLLVAFRKISARNILISALFTCLLFFLYSQTPVLRKIDSYVALGGDAGPQSRQIYFLIHLLIFFIVLATRRYIFRLSNIYKAEPVFTFIFYMIICISLVGIAFAPIAILLHYRMFASFALFFTIYLALCVSIHSNLIKVIYLFLILTLGITSLTNESVLNVYIGNTL